jgi:hypothetical protein
MISSDVDGDFPATALAWWSCRKTEDGEASKEG